MADVSKPTEALSARDDSVTGEALATPRLRAEARLGELLVPATDALRRILTTDMSALDNAAQSAGYKVQLTAAMHVIDGCLSIAAQGGGATTRKAAQILAAVGGDAVNKELMRRAAQRLRSSERQRIVEAVPAKSEADVMQPTAAEADGGDDATRSESTGDT